MKAITVGDRADSYGAHGGNMAHEIKAALFTLWKHEIQWSLAVYMV